MSDFKIIENESWIFIEQLSAAGCDVFTLLILHYLGIILNNVGAFFLGRQLWLLLKTVLYESVINN